MAEVLGVVGSVIALIEVTDAIISVCCWYIKIAKEAKQDIINVINSVSSLKGILDRLHTIAAARGLQIQEFLYIISCIEESLVLCNIALHRLAKKLEITDKQISTETQRIVEIQKRFLWPWKQTEVAKDLEEIERYKTTLILIMAGENIAANLSIQETVVGLSRSIEEIASFQARDKVLRWYEKIIAWLKTCDPSTNHFSAWRKYEPITGNWFLQSQDFASWITGTTAFIWLRGIPGAGKTVLCSAIIDHVIGICTDQMDQYAYFYFDFNDPQKRTVSGMIRSLLVQLTMHQWSLSEEIDVLYKGCNEGTQDPGQDCLVETLLSLLRNSERTYFIVDALDECFERDELLQILARICGTSHVKLLVTSRGLSDTDQELSGIIEKVIEMTQDKIDPDISLHVQTCLEMDKRLRKWAQSVKEEIKAALIKGSNWM